MSKSYTPSNIKYTYKGYNSLLKDISFINYTPGGIPKIILKTSWHTRNNLPTEVVLTLNNTILLNPDYNLYYFDDNEVLEFMKSYSKKAYNAYKKLIPGAFKADLFRYCILEKYGGCYSDIGHISYISFNQICENNKLILVKDLNNTGIHNALMCVIPHHPFIKKLVDSCIENIGKKYYGYSSLSITGPVLVGTLFYKFFYNNLDYLTQSDAYYYNNNLFEKEINKNLFNKYIVPGTKKDIKILKLEVIGDNDTSTPNGNNFIIDKDENILIKSKFDNYYNIMYSDQPYYNNLWKTKNVYNDNGNDTGTNI